MLSRTVKLIVLISFGTGLVLGQGSTGDIVGTVKDASGAVLPGTVITIKHLETGLTRAAQSDGSGNFAVPSLPVGEYEITAEKVGFRRELRRGINLAVAQDAQVN